MKPWKSEIRAMVVMDLDMLQWGHGDEAVEESGYKPEDDEVDELQWGHGDEAVEESSHRRRTARHALASMGPRR